MARARFLKFSLPAAVLCTAATACGSSSSTSLATVDAARLHHDVASIRSAANGHDPAAAHAAVRTLDADISQLRAANRLAPADASVLLSDAGQIDRKVPPEVSAPAEPAAPASAPGPGPQPPAKGKGRSKGHGNGHRHGNGQGDGGDGGD